MRKKIILASIVFISLFITGNVKADSIKYKSHVQSYGWQDYVSDGEISGTVGKSKRLESFIIDKSELNIEGDILYRSYVEGLGWQDYVTTSNISGTVGQSKKIEMISIKLTEDLSNDYDIYYRVHVQKLGWLDWTKNDEVTGSYGYNYQIEAIEIKLVSKTDEPPSPSTNIYKEKPLEISYKSHVQSYGWQDYVSDGKTSGTIGKSKRLESFIIDKSETSLEGDILYRSYIEGIGWQDYVSSTNISGTVGQSKKIEMISIKLTEDLSNEYDIYYRVHVQKLGWLDWAKNDEITGSFGYRYQIEAIEIKLIKKGLETPNNTEKTYVENDLTLKYQSYYNNKWQSVVTNGETSGTIGQSTPIRGFKINLSNPVLNDWIEYRSYVHNKGWQDYVKGGNVSGNTNDSIIEMIQIKLSSEASNFYDIYYRVHVQKLGWLDWTKNDTITGSLGYGYRIEAIEVKLLKKDDNSTEVGTNIFNEKENYLTYSTHMQSYGWLDSSITGEINGKPQSGKRMEAIKININNKTVEGDIKYSAHVQSYGWLDFVNDGNIAGTVGQSKRMEAIKIELTGQLSEIYDIYYKAYVDGMGWLDWAKNGEIAGSMTIQKPMEAIQIVLVDKGSEAPGSTEQSYTESIFRIIDGKTYLFERGEKVTGFKEIKGEKYFFNDEGVLIRGNVAKVIDVSSHQRLIDWSSVKNDGVDGAIIRIGYGTSYTTDECYFDPYFENNYYGTLALNMLSGIYLYSYAIDTISATIEANFVLDKLKKYNVDKNITIYYDLEENDWTTTLTPLQYHNIVETFSNIIEQKGYKVNVYSYLYWANNRLDAYARSKLTWIAHYNNICLYEGNYNTWQYTANGHVNGINGVVDLNVMFK